MMTIALRLRKVMEAAAAGYFGSLRFERFQQLSGIQASVLFNVVRVCPWARSIAEERQDDHDR